MVVGMVVITMGMGMVVMNGNVDNGNEGMKVDFVNNSDDNNNGYGDNADNENI